MFFFSSIPGAILYLQPETYLLKVLATHVEDTHNRLVTSGKRSFKASGTSDIFKFFTFII